MLILGIDTSGKTASVALLEDNLVLAQNTIYTKRTHSQVILPLCKKMLEDSQRTLEDVDRIAVADGPGSYTGIRIGISAVKALSFALNIKCSGVSTLEGLAYNMLGFNGIICSIMNARANLVYAACFKGDDNKVSRLTDDDIISDDELFNILSDKNDNIVLVGDAADEFYSKYADKIKLTVAPPHLKLQLASSLCLAAANDKDGISPEQLQASYLQVTKAEKDHQPT